MATMNTNGHHIEQGSLNVYGAILEYKLTHNGVSPSIPDLVNATGYQSTKPIMDRLNDLEARGLIKRVTGTPRSIQVVGGQWDPPRVPTGLTMRQADVYRAIVSYARTHDGNPPTLSDIGRKLSLSSDSTARFHIQALEKSGHLSRVGGRHRSTRVNGASYTVNMDAVPPVAKSFVSGQLARIMAAKNGTQ